MPGKVATHRQRAEREPEVADQGQQGVAQPVPVHDGRPAQALGPGRLDERLGHDVDRAGTHQARHDAGPGHPERQAGQDEVLPGAVPGHRQQVDFPGKISTSMMPSQKLAEQAQRPDRAVGAAALAQGRDHAERRSSAANNCPRFHALRKSHSRAGARRCSRRAAAPVGGPSWPRGRPRRRRPDDRVIRAVTDRLVGGSIMEAEASPVEIRKDPAGFVADEGETRSSMGAR